MPTSYLLSTVRLTGLPSFTHDFGGYTYSEVAARRPYGEGVYGDGVFGDVRAADASTPLVPQVEWTPDVRTQTYVDAPVIRGRVSLDESRAPRISGDVTVTIPAPIRPLIDPQTGAVRALVTMQRADLSTSLTRTLTMNLLVEEKSHDVGEDETTFTLSSDESVLLRRRNAGADDYSLLYEQGSLRAIVNKVLTDAGLGTLQAGATDVPYRVLTDKINYLLNPSAEASTINWAEGLGATDLTRVASPVVYGNSAFRWTATNGAAQSNLDYTPIIEVSGGQGYRFKGYIRSQTAGTQFTALVRFYRSDDTVTRQGETPVGVTSTSAWTFFNLVFSTTPEDASYARVFVTTRNNPATQFHYVDAMSFVDYSPFDQYLEEETEYWDGNTPDTDEYSYGWMGSAGVSESVRIALIERDLDTLVWKTGDSAWDVLEPLVQSAGFRLYSDVDRAWHLVDTAYLAPGQTVIAYGTNLINGSDLTTVQSDDWCDGAIVKYEWIDRIGDNRTKYDSFKSGSVNTVLIEVKRPYPGPGFAEYIVQRAQSLKSTQYLEAVVDLNARPSQLLSSTLGSNDRPFVGLVRSVEFDLTEGVMSIETRGISQAPAFSYAAGDPGISYQDVPAGMSYTELDWTAL